MRYMTIYADKATGDIMGVDPAGKSVAIDGLENFQWPSSQCGKVVSQQWKYKATFENDVPALEERSELEIANTESLIDLSREQNKKVAELETELAESLNGTIEIGGYTWPLDPIKALERDGYFRAMQLAAEADSTITTIKYLDAAGNAVELPLASETDIDGKKVNSQIAMAIADIRFDHAELVSLAKEATLIEDIKKIKTLK